MNDIVMRFIEGVGPVLDDVFPEWDKGHREMLMTRLTRSVEHFEREVNEARRRVGLDAAL